MKRLKKKTVLMGLMVFLLVSVAGTLVYGALKKDDSVLNRLAFGNLKGDLSEHFDGSQELLGDVAYPKEVMVKNSGNLNLFVRVMVFPEITTPEGVSLGASIGKEIKIEMGKDWLSGDDGYYYYLSKLPKEATTPPVFSEITVDSKGVNERYQGAKLTIQVKSETISAADFHYRQAWWGLETAPTEPAHQTIDQLLVNLIDKK